MTRLARDAAWVAALAAALVAAGSSPAAAQKKKKKPAPAAEPAPAPEPAAAPDPEAEPAPNPEDAPPDERTMEGVDENPGAPKAETIEQPWVAPVVTAGGTPKRAGYPIEEVLRPLTLPAVTAEVAIDLRSTTFPVFGGTLRARYGITNEAQIGLRYGLGAAFDPDGDGPDGTEFKTGKAIAVDLAYQVQPWVAAELSVPIYVDPFAIGVVLGAPVKFRFADKLALFALRDVVEIKLDGFVPSVVAEERNVGNAAALDVNAITDDGTLRFAGGAIVQLKPEVALIGSFGTEFDDFDSLDPNYPLDVAVQYSLSQKLDVLGRLGFEDLDNAEDSFGLRVTAQVRI